MATSHRDQFAREHLPALDEQPRFIFDLPTLQFPAQINCADELLDRHVREGRGHRLCLQAPGGWRWSYQDLQDKANRIANLLVNDLGLIPGNRVLLRGFNSPMLVACWFGVVKAGGIVVATMPMLRSKELSAILKIGKISHALCESSLAEELDLARDSSSPLREIRYYDNRQSGFGESSLEAAMTRQSSEFQTLLTALDDCCLFGFTSGTTGVPKATIHFHRDILASCQCFPPYCLKAQEDDIFIGSPPVAFTYGLGGLVLFPLAIGASTVLVEKPTPQALSEAILEFKATIMFTAPTSYRALAAQPMNWRASTLRKCVSAGEALPKATRALWKEVSGIEIIDGIGSTELLHIFIAHTEEEARPGATGKIVPGYRAKIIDDEGRELADGELGNLAVQGPTGCRYLDDKRQANYVQNGWNITGDIYSKDKDGYYYYQARADDMIISAGYNIAAPDVEEALMQHESVAECAVIGIADEERGQIVKGFVVLKPDYMASEKQVKLLQDFVKSVIAPYKYPRAIEFVKELPRTQTGKLQRFRLKS